VFENAPEREGFEPSVPQRGTTVFETAPIDRSGTSPRLALPDRLGRPAAPRVIGAAATRRNRTVAHLSRSAGEVEVRERRG
jgi:hypothetical protein